MTAQPIKLYRHVLSGHSHRVELLLSLLNQPYETIDVDLLSGAHKAPDFLTKNVFGQVPVIDDNGLILADSNAILVYLASKYDAARTWLPADPAGAAAVQRWLSIAAGDIAFGPATARMATVFGAPVDAEAAIARADALFQVMEQVLGTQTYLIGNTPTIADLAAYSYIAHAPEGNCDLAAYTHLRAWLRRIEGLERFVAMPATPVGLAA